MDACRVYALAQLAPTAPGAAPVAFAARARRAVHHGAMRAWPREACGLLVGRATAHGIGVARAVRARNRARSLDRYDLDPGDWLRIHDAAARCGLDIVGVWHSHPNGAATPSRRDCDLAWPSLVYLIAAVTAPGVLALRCWQRRDERMIEVSMS